MIRSFPVQLLLLHFRKHIMLLLLWLVLTAMLAGWVAPEMGFQYLFLDPEYLGRVGFFSYLVVGAALGFFAMSWNLSTYLLVARYFAFLASLSRPFLKFCLNNILLPIGVLVLYLFLLYRFYADTNNWGGLLAAWGGLLGGLILSLLVYMIYFYLTNRDIYYYTGNRPLAPNRDVLQPQGRQRGLPLREAAYPTENPYRVRFYWDNRFRVRLVRSVAHYDRATLESVYRQNHWNALFLQFASILFLVLLGLLIDYPLFQIPAGASMLILFSVIIFFLGVISYWFAEWRYVIIVGFLFGVNFATSLVTLQRSNYAYGIDYRRPDKPYNETTLAAMATADRVRRDSLQTIRMLNNWHARQQTERPTLVLMCTSGGGLSAAYWTTLVTQELEAATDRELLRHTALVTGASGGMLGLAYVRELQRRYLRGGNYDPLDPQHRHNISQDLLNPISFSIVSNDIFLPLTEVQIGGQTYLRDRAYNFERAYNRHTGGILRHPLAHYRTDEITGLIPQLIITPTILNDGRLLAISALGQSHLMTSPLGRRKSSGLNPDLVDLATLLGDDQRDSLRTSTALRMNASYPYVLPFVQLPTQPTVRVMDAGYRDNYGVLTAARFVQNFAPWIKAKVGRVVLVQISAFRGREPRSDDPKGLLESLAEPLSVTGNFFSVQSLEQDNTLSYLYDLLGPDRFHLLRFNYRPRQDDEKRLASISFHLSEGGRRELERAWTETDPTEIERLVRLLNDQAD